MTRPRDIDWDAQPLGAMGDWALGRALGVSGTAVWRQRRLRGIGAHRKHANATDWDAQPLGEVPDSELAANLGMNRMSVWRAREERGIPAKLPYVVWDEQPLGMMRDSELAEALGVNRRAVGDARGRRGIAPFSGPLMCPCGEVFITTRRKRIYCGAACRSSASFFSANGYSGEVLVAMVAIAAIERKARNHLEVESE